MLTHLTTAIAYTHVLHCQTQQKIGERQIKLKMIKDQQMFGKWYCRLIAVAHVTGALPWCLAGLVAKYSYLPYSTQVSDIQRLLNGFINGCVAASPLVNV
jgi:hypothetical protein